MSISNWIEIEPHLYFLAHFLKQNFASFFLTPLKKEESIIHTVIVTTPHRRQQSYDVTVVFTE